MNLTPPDAMAAGFVWRERKEDANNELTQARCEALRKRGPLHVPTPNTGNDTVAKSEDRIKNDPPTVRNALSTSSPRIDPVLRQPTA